LEPDYKSWISRWEATEGELAAMRRQAAGFEHPVRVSVLLVVSDPDEFWIKNSVNSVLQQVYPHLELCVCTNGPQRPHVLEILEGYADDRIKVRHLPERNSQADAYNVALSMVTGECVALLGQGDELAPDAAFRVAEFLQGVPADVIYTDEDHTDVTGRRSDPEFKPYWAPDLLLLTPYTGRLCVVQRKVLEAVGGFREGFDGAEEHDLFLRLSEKTDRIYHLPGVLYHRSGPPGPDASEEGPSQASLRAIEEALARRGERAAVEPDLEEGSFRVTWHLSGRAKVSLILSNLEEEPDASLVEELERKTSYPIHQLIVASGDREAYPVADDANHLFPARAMNLAADRADGEYLVFASASAQVLDSGWLSDLLRQAQRRGVGAVGCKLLNPDGSLRHGGSWVDLSRLVGYASESASEGDGQPLVVDQTFNFEAASAECMMVRKAAFEEVGGFDEERVPTTFYDLDLSFRLQEEGLRNVYTPYASLICARSPELLPSEREIAYVWRRWWEKLIRLLYYRRSPVHRAVPRAMDEDILMAAISS